jgi:hypothetical protein
MDLFSDRPSPGHAARVEYRAAKAELEQLTDPDSDEYLAANARVIAAQENLPAWHISKTS